MKRGNLRILTAPKAHPPAFNLRQNKCGSWVYEEGHPCLSYDVLCDVRFLLYSDYMLLFVEYSPGLWYTSGCWLASLLRKPRRSKASLLAGFVGMMAVRLSAKASSSPAIQKLHLRNVNLKYQMKPDMRKAMQKPPCPVFDMQLIGEADMCQMITDSDSCPQVCFSIVLTFMHWRTRGCNWT